MTTSTDALITSNLIWEDTCEPRVKQALRLGDWDAQAKVLEFDVCVIGAGVTGLSAAATAASAGARTVLVERAPHAAAGASGRNAGIVCMGANLLRCELGADSQHDWLWKQTTEVAHEIYAEAAGVESPVRAKRCGSLSMAATESDGECFDDEVRCRHEMGLQAKILDATEVEKLTGGRLACQRISRTLYLPDEGRCHPWTLCALLAERARKAGATMYGGANVMAQSSDESQWSIELEGNRKIIATALIQSTGPTVGPNKRIYAMAFETTLPDNFPVFQDAAPFTYFDYRTGDGYIVCTGGPYGTAGDTAADADYFTAMANTVRKWIPELAGAEPKYRWAVDLKVTPDMMPQLLDLKTAGAPGFAIAGLGALGVLPGILLGRMAATQLTTKLSGQKS